MKKRVIYLLTACLSMIMVSEPLSAGSEIVKQVVVETRDVKNPVSNEESKISTDQRADHPVIVEKRVVRAGHEKAHGGVLIISGTALLLIVIILLIVLL